MNHQIIWTGNVTNRKIKTRQMMLKMGQMTMTKVHKGANLPKYQLSTIAVQDKTSWKEKSTRMTQFKERAQATHQAQMNKKTMTIMRILIYKGLHVIDKIPLHINRLLTVIYMDPNCLV